MPKPRAVVAKCAEPAPTLQAGRRVLVVEDNPVTRRLYRAVLEGEGFEVTEAGTAREALALVHAERPDLVLQDIVLEDMDGCILAQRIRELDGGGTLLIVAVSGTPDPYVAAARHGPFDEWLTKPVELARLVSILKDRLRQARVGFERHRILMVDDDPLQLKAGKARLQLLGFTVSTARGGREALVRAVEDVPDLIASDVVMPDMSGFELCKAVRSDPRIGHVPVVLMTNNQLEPSDGQTASCLGACALVVRTPDLAAVVGAVQSAIANGAPAPPDAAGAAAGVAPAGAPAAGSAATEYHHVLRRLERQSAVAAELERSAGLWRSTLTFLEHVGDHSAPLPDPDLVLREILASYQDVLGMPLGVAYAVGDDGGFDLKTTIGFPGPLREPLAGFFARPDVLTSVLSENAPRLLSRDAGLERADAELMAECGAGAMILVPLVACGHPLAVVMVATPKRWAPPDFVELVTATLASAANALHLARSIRKLAASESRFRGIAESTGEGILVTDGDGRILYGNPAAGRILGDHPALRGGVVTDPMPFLDGQVQPQRGHARTADGRTIPVEVTISVFEDELGRHRRAHVFHDVSERLKLQHYSFLAERDPLTGLVNRRRFEEILLEQLAESRTHGAAGALLMLDLDGFKSVNDTHGHAAGDRLLNRVSRILQATIRETDVACRLGGDEFAILLPRETREGASRCASRILDRLAQAGEGRARVAVHGSIGIALYPGEGDTPQTLLEYADRALYRAKQAGGARALFDSSGPPDRAAA